MLEIIKCSRLPNGREFLLVEVMVLITFVWTAMVVAKFNHSLQAHRTRKPKQQTDLSLKLFLISFLF